ncbi:MAG: TerC family protein [Bacillota bacterium]
MEIVTALLSIIIINLILSGDNAVVIALASRNLPARQQKQAVFWGSGGAIGLRVILTIVAVLILRIPFLQAAGGILLVWIALKLLRDEESKEEYESADNLWGAIKTIIFADFLMSLDNVLAVAGASKGNIPLLITGLAISIPIIVFGSQIILFFMKKFPIIVYVGAAVLGWTAGEMFVRDRQMTLYLHHLPGTFEWLIPLVLTLFVVIVGYWLNARRKKLVAKNLE